MLIFTTDLQLKMTVALKKKNFNFQNRLVCPKAPYGEIAVVEIKVGFVM